MKYLLLVVAFLSLSCKAQTVSLETAAQCLSDPNCPDYIYEKDVNNTLDKYVGTWKGTFEGKTYELKFNKNLYENSLGHKRDRIKGRLRITTAGNPLLTVFDNFNEPDDEKTHFSGLGLASNLQSYMMYFSDSEPQGCINSGTVYLRMKPATPNQMSIFYLSDYDTVRGVCPSSFKTTIPEHKPITLTKQ